MKILLLNLPTSLEDRDDFETLIQPYGLAILSAYLKHHGRQVTLYDAHAYRLIRNEIIDYVIKVNPDIIGLTCMTYQLGSIVSFLKELKNVLPNIVTVLGGCHVSAEPFSTLKNHPEVDYVVIGEGEKVLLEFDKKISAGESIQNIDGLCFRKNGEIIINQKRQFIENLDELPYADWDSLPMYKYFDSMTTRKNYSTMFASRGCPYHCTFCASGVVLGKKYRKRSPDHFVGEISLLYDKHHVREFIFGDSTFNIDNQWVSEICEKIIRLNRDIIWNTSVRADRLDKEVLKLMKRSGCRLVLMGVESGDNAMLKSMRKGESLETIKKGIEMIKEVKMNASHGFIIGMPGETKASIEKTIQFAKSINHVTGFTFATPLPGTEFYEQAQSEGLTVNDWSKFDCYSISYVPKGMTRQELSMFYSKAIKAVYFRPSHLLKRVLETKSWTQFRIRIRYLLRIIKRRMRNISLIDNKDMVY